MFLSQDHSWYMATVFLKWANPGLFLFIFSFFSHSNSNVKHTIWTIQLEKSIDGVVGTQIRGGRMEGPDISTELWWHPSSKQFGSPKLQIHRLLQVPTRRDLLMDSSIYIWHARKAYIWKELGGSLGFISSVTRLGDLLDFGQLFKAVGSNQFTQISHILWQFL